MYLLVPAYVNKEGAFHAPKVFKLLKQIQQHARVRARRRVVVFSFWDFKIKGSRPGETTRSPLQPHRQTPQSHHHRSINYHYLPKQGNRERKQGGF